MLLSLNKPGYAPKMSEGRGSLAAAGADAGFSPAQLAAIAAIMEEVLNKTRMDCMKHTATGSSERKGDTANPRYSKATFQQSGRRETVVSQPVVRREISTSSV